MPEETIDEAGAKDLIEWFHAFLGNPWMTDQLDARARHAAAHGHWSPDDVHGNALVDAMAIFQRDERVLGFGEALAAPAGRKLLAAASDVQHVVKHLTSGKAQALAALLRKRDPTGFLYQCRVAAHHIRDGCELASFSLGESPAGDVVVRVKGGSVEVQCKALTPGAGRRISNRTFNALAMTVLNAAGRMNWRGTIRLECDLRLDDADIPLLGGAIVSRMEDATSMITTPARYHLHIETRSGNVPNEELNVALGAVTGIDHRRPYLGVLGNRHETGVRVLLVAGSKKHDKVSGKMLSTAVSATRQLSGGLPGVVCVHTPEPVNWIRVAEAGVLDRQVTEVMRSNDLARAGAIVFTSEDASAGAFVYENPDAARSFPEGFRVFGRTLSRS
jgi:hypothetical protein